MPKKKATEIYKGYKEKIDEFMNTKTTASIVNVEEAKTNNDKLDEKWAKLNAGGHSIVTIRGGLTEISGIQNKGCRQSRSVQNQCSRLFVCSSMLVNGKFAETSGVFCPFFVYCKSTGKHDDEWVLTEHKEAGPNCPFHIPTCNSKANNVPVSYLMAQMGGVMTSNNVLGSKEYTKAIRDTPNLEIHGKFSKKTLNRAVAELRNGDSMEYLLNYNRVPDFCIKFNKQNEGSIAEYEVEEGSQRFKTLTVVLNLPLWILHSGGIPSASVDGAHSKNQRYKGQNLAVTGRESYPAFLDYKYIWM